MAVSRVTIGGNTVGIIGLEEIFQQAKAAGLQDAGQLKDFILGKVKVNNYIPSRLEPTYREDLFEEFLVFTGELPSRSRANQAMEVRLYGASCSRCEHLDTMVKQILSRRGLKVDYQYITDISEMSRAGIMGSPALAVGGKVVLSGQVPTEKHLEGIILKALNLEGADHK